MSERPRVAITMGDAAGIGPEITVKSLADPQAAGWCIPFVLGDAGVLAHAARTVGVDVPIRRIAAPEEATGTPGVVEVIDAACIDLGAHRWGVVQPAYGEAAVRWTKEAGQMALEGRIDAMVSAPLNKEAMHEAGYSYEGQTEILGELTRSKPAMVMVVDRMRLMLFTNHMAMRQVCDYIRKDRVLERLVLADAALRDMGIARPRIAVAGLNPHASENGLFGREELDHIVPAVAAARERGIDAQGPFPADTVFLKAREGLYDMTIALYHDQGLMAVKLVGFGRVVTLLIGLPLIRTSTGHGTAFDIAGKNIADHRNLLEALRVAAEVARGGKAAQRRGLAAAFGRAA
ncbi:MAG TPA: 4-hydroxythreonine-4-phosphate dehydrogenase PdxA [Candidatus Limnocylindria bacterium]|nr:4-hydroxythreonine-4-phosphate dehydrogenase PdxA [Candidatus Limnocylindria bacterium]